jgi:hypothetical protein
VTRAPIGTVLRRTGSSLVRHGGFYALVTAAAVGASWLIARAVPGPETIGVDVATSVVSPIFNAIVIATSLADWNGIKDARGTWSRILDRSWALIVIDFLLTVLQVYDITFSRGDLVDFLLAIPLFVMVAATCFAEVVAVADDDSPWWWIPVRSFGASAIAAFSPGMFVRAASLGALQIAVSLAIELAADVLTQQKVGQALFWSAIVLGMLTLPPIQALVTFTYLDAAGGESKRSCDE